MEGGTAEVPGVAIFARSTHAYPFHGIMGPPLGDARETIEVVDLNSKGRKSWPPNT